MSGRPKPSDPSVSKRLAKQKQKNTEPELVVRRLLHQLGHRFRLSNRDLPGSPDIANRSKKWAVFVHGCYWHAHEGCPRATVPKSNRQWWLEKFAANRERDRRKETQLRDLGFRVVVVWECELAYEAALVARLRDELARTE